MRITIVITTAYFKNISQFAYVNCEVKIFDITVIITSIIEKGHNYDLY